MGYKWHQELDRRWREPPGAGCQSGLYGTKVVNGLRAGHSQPFGSTTLGRFWSKILGLLGAQHSVTGEHDTVNRLLALSCSFRLQVVSGQALHDCLCLLLIYTTTQNLPRPDVSQVQNLLNKVLLEHSHTTRLCLICRPLFTVTAKPASHRTREAI